MYRDGLFNLLPTRVVPKFFAPILILCAPAACDSGATLDSLGPATTKVDHNFITLAILLATAITLCMALGPHSTADRRAPPTCETVEAGYECKI